MAPARLALLRALGLATLLTWALTLQLGGVTGWSLIYPVGAGRQGSRERTFTWSDPLATAQAAAELPGIDAIREIAAGELPPPPIAALLDFEIALVEPGRVIFAIEPAEWMYNPIGSVHGGVAATLLDSSLGCAVHTVLDAGARYTTTDLHVRYVRAMTADTGRVLADRAWSTWDEARDRRGAPVRGGGRAALRARHHELLSDSLRPCCAV